jgi:hypothetical protein
MRPQDNLPSRRLQQLLPPLPVNINGFLPPFLTGGNGGGGLFGSGTQPSATTLQSQTSSSAPAPSGSTSDCTATFPQVQWHSSLVLSICRGLNHT